MDFITHIDQVPLTRTTRQQLEKIAKALQMPEEAAAGYAIEQFVAQDGERLIKIEAARLVVEKSRKRDREPGAPICPTQSR